MKSTIVGVMEGGEVFRLRWVELGTALMLALPCATMAAELVSLQCTFPNGTSSKVTLDYDARTVLYFDDESPQGASSSAQFTETRITWQQSEVIAGTRTLVSYYLDRISGELGYQYSNRETGLRSNKSSPCVRAQRRF